jgi:hypothetical protein
MIQMSTPTSVSNVLKFRKPRRSSGAKQQGDRSRRPEEHSPATQNPILEKSAAKAAALSYSSSKAEKTQAGKTKSSKPRTLSLPLPAIIPTPYARRAQKAMLDRQQRRITGAAVWTRGRAMAQRVLRFALLLVLLVGVGTVWDAGIGDGALPQLNNLKQSAPELVPLAQANSTAHLPLETAQRQYWESLSASRTLLLSLSPQIAYWLFTLNQQGHIVAHTPDDVHQTYRVAADTPLLAAYRHSENRLYLGEAFWQLSDGQKVAVIAHEYRHARQNPGKRLGYQLAQWMTLGQLHHESPMENEAMAYERQARTALGIQ